MNIKPVVFTDGLKNYSQFNELYKFYVEIWQNTWRELGVTSAGFRDDFYRFHTKVGLFIDNIPVAFHGYSLFDLNKESDREHSFFTKLGVPVTDQLLERGIRKVSTLEYLAVHPDYRRYSGFPLSEILIGFSAQYFKGSDRDAIVAVTRNNRKVNETAEKYGSYSIYKDLNLYNVDVDFIVFEVPKIRNNPNKDIQNIIDNLYQELWGDHFKNKSA